jgi:flagellar P-ring protein FlgI
MGRYTVVVSLVFALVGASSAQVGTPPAGAGAPRPPAGMPPPLQHDNSMVTLQTVARLAGENETPIRGMGLVMGLKGTGDQGADMVLARPLAQWYASNGNSLADLKDLAKSKAAAYVMLQATIPSGGARKGDKLDVIVAAGYGATNLEPGVLIVSPMLGPLAHQGVVGLASGVIHVTDPAHPTRGFIRQGLQITEDITMVAPGGTIELVVDPAYRAWRTTQVIASVINEANAPLDEQNPTPPLARAVDSMTVKIHIPAQEQPDPAGFISRVMTTRISPALLDLEPRIICNRQTGTIVATGNVEISTVEVASKDLVVTMTVPPPVPTPTDPLVKRENWVAVQTTGKPSDRTRIEDLLHAFKQLDVPIDAQIEILERISRSGSLHAKLVIE